MKFLMCKPTYFEVVYSINPWMNTNSKVDKKKVLPQWESVYQGLKDVGAKIELIDPVPGLPDMVFSANAGLIYKNNFVLSNFRFSERKPEEAHYKKWFQDKGYTIYEMPQQKPHRSFFEGMGDGFFLRNKLFFGYGFRSDKSAAHNIKSFFPEIEVIALELKNPFFYHLDTCFAPLNEDTIIYYPKNFTELGNKTLENSVENIIRVSDEDAQNFTCNCIQIKNKILINKPSKKLAKQLNDLSFEVIEFDLTEFKKSGGSVRCMVLNL